MQEMEKTKDILGIQQNAGKSGNQDIAKPSYQPSHKFEGDEVLDNDSLPRAALYDNICINHNDNITEDHWDHGCTVSSPILIIATSNSANKAYVPTQFTQYDPIFQRAICGHVDSLTYLMESSDCGSKEAKTLMMLVCYYSMAIDKVKALSYAEEIVPWLLEFTDNNTSDGDKAIICYLKGFLYKHGILVPKDEVEAFHCYTSSANHDDKNAYALYIVGHCYQHGVGVEMDMLEAIKYYTMSAEQGFVAVKNHPPIWYDIELSNVKHLIEAFRYYMIEQQYMTSSSAEQGYAVSQCDIGDCYKKEENTGVKLQEGISFYLLTANRVFASAQYDAAITLCYKDGIVIDKDLSEVVGLYISAMSHGLGLTDSREVNESGDNKNDTVKYSLAINQEIAVYHHNLALCFKYGVGVDKCMSKAVMHYTIAANEGHAQAQFCLASCYDKGTGVDKSLTEVIRLLILASNQGHARAQNSLGYYYSCGTGINKSLSEAVRYYTLAANQGLSIAQSNLGLCYAEGKSVTKNLLEARRLLELAGNQGLAGAHFRLAYYYEIGTGVDKNLPEAVRYYRLAADQGNANAQYNLGVCYEFGQGVDKNKPEALRYYKLAADQGNIGARQGMSRYNMGEEVANNIISGTIKWFTSLVGQA